MFSMSLDGPGRGSTETDRGRGAHRAALLPAAALPCTWSIRIENPALISFAGISKQVRKEDVIERKNLI